MRVAFSNGLEKSVFPLHRPCRPAMRERHASHFESRSKPSIFRSQPHARATIAVARPGTFPRREINAPLSNRHYGESRYWLQEKTQIFLPTFSPCMAKRQNQIQRRGNWGANQWTICLAPPRSDLLRFPIGGATNRSTRIFASDCAIIRYDLHSDPIGRQSATSRGAPWQLLAAGSPASKGDSSHQLPCSSDDLSDQIVRGSDSVNTHSLCLVANRKKLENQKLLTSLTTRPAPNLLLPTQWAQPIPCLRCATPPPPALGKPIHIADASNSHVRVRRQVNRQEQWREFAASPGALRKV